MDRLSFSSSRYGRKTNEALHFNPSGGTLKERENKGSWHQPWIAHQAKQDVVYMKKSLEQQITQCAQQVATALNDAGVKTQATKVKVVLSDAVRKSSDRVLMASWPAAASLRGLEKGEPVRSRETPDGDMELGIIVRVKSNGNYDIEKRVENLGEARRAAVRKTMERTGIRISIVEDRNIPPGQIQEVPGARHAAFNLDEEPEWELKVLEACRQFNIKKVAELFQTAVPEPMTFGAHRSGRY